MTLDLCGLGATHALGACLAARIGGGDVIGLRGGLGAGKSELARATIRARADAAIEVPSPSFTLVQDYSLGGLVLRHIDLYRLADPGELVELDLEAPQPDEVWLVEWPERAAGHLHPDLQIILRQGERMDTRIAELSAGARWQDRVHGLRDACAASPAGCAPARR